MSRAIVVTSGKGGVGKSTLTVTIGRILSEMDKKTVIVDADFGLNNVDLLMKLENSVVYDIVDVAENRCRISQALLKDNESKNLFVMPSAHAYDKSALDGQSLRAIVTALKTRFDFVLIDSPAGIEYGFHRAVSSADEALVVTTPHLSALLDAEKVVNLLAPYELKKITVALNRARGDMEKSGDAVSRFEVEKYLGIKVSGVIPDDDSLNVISTTSAVARRGSDGYNAASMLCKYLINGSGEIYDATKRYRGVLGAIKRKIRKYI